MSENGTKPVGDVARDRLRAYAERFEHFRQLARQVPAEHPDRLKARGQLIEAEEALIGDLTANAPNGAVERAVFEAYDAVDKLGGLMEKITDALTVVKLKEESGR